MLKGSVLELCPLLKSTAYLEGPPVRLGRHMGEEVGPGIAPQIGDPTKGAVGGCPAGTPACPTDPTGDVPVSHSLKQCLCRLKKSPIKPTNVKSTLSIYVDSRTCSPYFVCRPASSLHSTSFVLHSNALVLCRHADPVTQWSRQLA